MMDGMGGWMDECSNYCKKKTFPPRDHLEAAANKRDSSSPEERGEESYNDMAS